jgi:hypothetical protein
LVVQANIGFLVFRHDRACGSGWACRNLIRNFHDTSDRTAQDQPHDPGFEGNFCWRWLRLGRAFQLIVGLTD